jgi:lipoate-protein ligase A
MLHQGSIAATVAADELKEGFSEILMAQFQRYRLSPSELVLAEKLAREKYATARWNRRYVC